MPSFVARSLTIMGILVGSPALPSIAAASEGTRDPFELEVHLRPLPHVGLQPEPARLVLDLPRELLPIPRSWHGLDFDGTIKEWRFEVVTPGRVRMRKLASASLGAGLRIVVDSPTRAVRFRMSVLPRAAVAVISF
jgi:hypothetical protein